MIQNFELYNYFEFFIKDLGELDPSKLEIILEKELINAIIKNDTKKINYFIIKNRNKTKF